MIFCIFFFLVFLWTYLWNFDFIIYSNFYILQNIFMVVHLVESHL